jgi:hypothetical protein
LKRLLVKRHQTHPKSSYIEEEAGHLGLEVLIERMNIRQIPI